MFCIELGNVLWCFVLRSDQSPLRQWIFLPGGGEQVLPTESDAQEMESEDDSNESESEDGGDIN